MGEAVGFENPLAGKQSTRIALKPRDQSLTGRQVIQAGAQFGYDGAALGTARWRELEHSLGPGEQAVHIHEAGFGTHGGRHSTRQEGVLERARDPATGRYKALEGRMRVVGALEHSRCSMGDIVEARAVQALLLE